MENKWISIIMGFALLGFGCYTLYLRINSRDKLGKLASMKNFFGEKTGNILHLIFYSILPIIFGSLIVFFEFL
jgi:hypothetical protein